MDDKLSISQWAEDDKPREKLVLKGKHSLSDAELIAILIGSGNREETAVDLSKRILNFVNNNLVELSKLSVTDLCKFKGIGDAKAITIIAALELGRRRRESEVVQKKKITSSKDAYEILQTVLSDVPHEEFWVLMLNRANHVTAKIAISEGGSSSTIVDPKKIFKLALENKAEAMVLGHNHPSGNLKPSEDDIKITKKITEAGKFLEISILDHIIIGENAYFSFADEGLM